MPNGADPGKILSGRFFEEEDRRDFCAMMRSAQATPATVLKANEYSVRRDVRNTNRLQIADPWHDRVSARLASLKPQMEAHFGYPLGDTQESQFLCYAVGHFFQAHRDTGDAAHGNAAARRKIAVVILMNPGDYAGGLLILYGMGVPGSRLEIRGKPGGFVAFDATLVHEVTPVTQGERLSIANWFEAPGPS